MDCIRAGGDRRRGPAYLTRFVDRADRVRDLYLGRSE
jgi:hypothetical protein